MRFCSIDSVKVVLDCGVHVCFFCRKGLHGGPLLLTARICQNALRKSTLAPVYFGCDVLFCLSAPKLVSHRVESDPLAPIEFRRRFLWFKKCYQLFLSFCTRSCCFGRCPQQLGTDAVAHVWLPAEIVASETAHSAGKISGDSQHRL